MTVSPAEWPELRALLERALDATAEERARLLADLERTDPARGRELAELLCADGLESSVLDAGVSHWLEEFADADSPADGKPPAAPFVGWKASAIGMPEHGRWDRDFYTQTKAIYGGRR